MALSKGLQKALEVVAEAQATGKLSPDDIEAKVKEVETNRIEILLSKGKFNKNYVQPAQFVGIASSDGIKVLKRNGEAVEGQTEKTLDFLAGELPSDTVIVAIPKDALEKLAIRKPRKPEDEKAS